MEGTNLRGINEEGIKKLILNIYDYSEQINTILNSIDDLVNDTKKHFTIDENDSFYTRFSAIKDNFMNVRDNILSYAEEILKAGQNYQEINIDLFNMMNKAATAVEIGKKYTERR
ncbi:MAG: hypothetical protein ACM3O4_05960 [Ignavibacteriales bacterium]